MKIKKPAVKCAGLSSCGQKGAVTLEEKLSCRFVCAQGLTVSCPFSPQKSESVHDKRQNTEALAPSFPSFYGELPSSKYMWEC